MIKTLLQYLRLLRKEQQFNITTCTFPQKKENSHLMNHKQKQKIILDATIRKMSTVFLFLFVWPTWKHSRIAVIKIKKVASRITRYLLCHFHCVLRRISQHSNVTPTKSVNHPSNNFTSSPVSILENNPPSPVALVLALTWKLKKS